MHNKVSEEQVFVGNLFGFCDCTRRMASSPLVRTPTQFPQAILFLQKYSFRSRNTSDPVIRRGKLMLQRSYFLTSFIPLYLAKQSRTAQLLTFVDRSS